MNRVFVLGSERKPLMPCTPARARRLLRDKKAAVFRMQPFTIILRFRADGETQPIEFKTDPGSKTTGIALVAAFKMGLCLIWAANLAHRGHAIRTNLESRRSLRCGRRGRKTRYRQARFQNRSKPAGWLPPSLVSRVDNLRTWYGRLLGYAPITSAEIETVRFDTHAMTRHGIEGVEYQQGELSGYEVREYLLEKWHRTCAYCGKKDHWIDAACVGETGARVHIPGGFVPLQIKATGRGTRQVVRTDRYGFPRGAAGRCKRVQGFQTGDGVRLEQPNGKYAGTHTGWLAGIRITGEFDIKADAGKIAASYQRFTLLQRADGYEYH